MSILNNRKIVYYFDEEAGGQSYGKDHPLKPERIRITHSLIKAYGLFDKMNIYSPVPYPAEEMVRFHTADYIQFLQKADEANFSPIQAELDKYLDKNSPLFNGIFRYNQRLTGASIGAAQSLAEGDAEIALNWAAGSHHARRSFASGYCYVNDIVLSILELLKSFQRVLYVDIDVHHGDGVERAFYDSNRVMTVSFHRGGDFFPWSGGVGDTGAKAGMGYAVNVPLREGIGDDSYARLFREVFDRAKEVFRPGVVLMQCGSDSLAGDPKGGFNLTLKGHGDCVRRVIEAGVPCLLVGGGGYNVSSVARCWTYETALCTNISLANQIPPNSWQARFAPDHSLHIQPSNMEDGNSEVYLGETKRHVFESLSRLEHSPSVPIKHSRNKRVDQCMRGKLLQKAKQKEEF